MLVQVGRIAATTFHVVEALEQATPCHARHMVDGVDRLGREDKHPRRGLVDPEGSFPFL